MLPGPATVVSLPRPLQAADRGACALGIVMLLASSGGLLLAGSLMVLGILTDSTFFVMGGALAGTRSLYHRRAAMALATGAAHRAQAMSAYSLAAAVHTLATGGMLAAFADPMAAAHLTALLLVWPTLLLLYRRNHPRLWDGDLAHAPALGEDVAIGAVAVTLMVLGGVGLCIAGLALHRIVVLDAGGIGAGLLLAGFLSLGVRALMRLRLGERAQSSPTACAHEIVTRDLNLSVFAAVAVATVSGTGLAAFVGPLAGVLGACLAAWAVLDWPLAIHRTLAVRRFHQHAGGEPPKHIAPDQGRSALSWLLLLLGSATAVHAAFGLLRAPTFSSAEIQAVTAAGGGLAASLLVHSPWWALSAGIAATVAGAVQLSRHRLTSLVTAAFVATLAAAILADFWPAYRAVSGDWVDVALSPAMAFHLRATALVELGAAGGLLLATWRVFMGREANSRARVIGGLRCTR